MRARLAAFEENAICILGVWCYAAGIAAYVLMGYRGFLAIGF